MKKTCPLEVEGHKPARVIEMIHRDVKKYLKRERRKELPEGVDFWDFDCRVGGSIETAEVVHVSKISEAISSAPEKEWQAIYVEILVKQGVRMKRDRPPYVAKGKGSE